MGGTLHNIHFLRRKILRLYNIDATIVIWQRLITNTFNINNLSL